MKNRPTLSRSSAWSAVASLLGFCALPALAQTPTISALFPAGAKAGETVEVSVRGGNLAGAKRIVVIGPEGVTAELNLADVQVDESSKPLFQQKCQQCHEVRSPANRTLTPEQWAATVDRMINQRSAPINKEERDKIVVYLQSSARAGQVTAKIQVAPNAVPGKREIRLMTDKGASTAWPFEVSTLPEATAQEPNSEPAQPQKVTLPVLVNGTIAKDADRDYFAFDAKKGQHLTFNLKGFRLNEQSQTFFNPVLYLYDAGGKVLAKSHGYFDFDPVIDWTAPADGTYTLLVRDLLWNGSPASVYRLAMGELPYDTALSPPGGRPGASVSVTTMGALGGGQAVAVQLPMGADGITMVPTPAGEAPFLVRDLPDGGGPLGPNGAAVPLPALFRGKITQARQADVFRVLVKNGGTGLQLYARRLRSPLQARLRILDAKNNEKRVVVADGARDIVLNDAFPAPGEYLVEVSDADNKYGPNFVYCLEALDGQPDFSLEASPDNISIGPGGTRALLVRATRRHRVSGPITLTIPNLPPGVTATPAVIPPDDDKAIILLSAAPGAASDLRVAAVDGALTLEGGGGIVRRAQPMEIYDMNNQPRLMARSSFVVAVAAEPPPFTVTLDTSTLTLSPNQEADVKVTIQRREGFKGDVSLSVPAAPPGIEVRNLRNIPPQESEAILRIRANGGARFLSERPLKDLPPMWFAITGSGGGVTLSSAPLIVVGQEKTAKTP